MIEHLHDREKALESLGWRGREAEWIALVCLHSGLFTRAQFCFYFDGAFRNRAERFVRALVDRRMAVEDDRAIFPGGAKACRISNKEIYRKLGIENVRHRRKADDSVMLRRLLSLDYVLENPELPWLPTEQEKVAFFELLGIDRNLIPRRVYQGAVGKQTRYFALKLPIAIEAKTATFAYIDPGKDTDTELRSWGAAHRYLWGLLRKKGRRVHVVAIGADHKATMRAKAALRSWSNGAGERDEPIAEGPTQDDPAVKAEMQQIEDVMRRGDRAGLSKYGGFQGATLRLIELRKLPKSKGTTGISIDGYETWVSRRLRMLDADL